MQAPIRWGIHGLELSYTPPSNVAFGNCETELEMCGSGLNITARSKLMKALLANVGIDMRSYCLLVRVCQARGVRKRCTDEHPPPQGGYQARGTRTTPRFLELAGRRIKADTAYSTLVRCSWFTTFSYHHRTGSVDAGTRLGDPDNQPPHICGGKQPNIGNPLFTGRCR